MTRAVASVNCHLNHHLLSAPRPSLALLEQLHLSDPALLPPPNQPPLSSRMPMGGLPCTVDAISVRDIGDTASSLASVVCRHCQPITRPLTTANDACFRILLSSHSSSISPSTHSVYVYSQVPCSGDTNLFRASPWCYCRLKRLDIPARTPYLHMQLNPCAQTATHRVSYANVHKYIHLQSTPDTSSVKKKSFQHPCTCWPGAPYSLLQISTWTTHAA